MNYHLISFDLCPYVQRAVITLKYKQVDFQITYIDLSQPPEWFLAISPMGKVPVLTVDGTALFESAVIIEYLDETNPPPLHPQDPLQRAYHRAWMEFGSHLLGRQYRLLTLSEPTPWEHERQALLSDLQQLEKQLADVSEKPFFNGKGFSLIDAAYAPLFMRLALMNRYHPLGVLDHLPKTTQWSDALLALPAVQDSVMADFAERFRHRFAQAGYFGRYLTG